MMRAFIPVCTGALLVLAAFSFPATPLHAQVVETPTAIAVPLAGITIDGNLGDWPAGMTKYPILNNGDPYGPTDLDGADLRTSEDLSPVFMVGYNQANNVIYLAVEVRDDIEIIGYGFNKTDACELYVEGTKEGKVVSLAPTPRIFASVQLVACPTGGSYNMKQPGMEPANPRMQNYDIQKTKTRCAYSRKGVISVYEWAIESFDSVPDVPTKLIPGKTIGMDIVLNDIDSETDTPSWVCWGPYKPMKAYNAESLGNILLAGSSGPGDIGTVTGTVKDARTKEAFSEFVFGVYRGDDLLRYVRADKDGKYAVTLLGGKYALQPKPLQGVVAKPAKKVKVRAGKETVANFTPKPIPLPKSIEKCAALYRSLQSYRDSTTIEIQTSAGATKQSEQLPYSLAFTRPNKLRFVCSKTTPQEFVSLYSNGADLVVFKKKDNRYMVAPAPGKLDMTALQSPVWLTIGSMVDLHFIISDNPLTALLRNIETISGAGTEKLDSETVSVIDITKPVTSLAPERILPVVSEYGLPGNMTVSLRLWIGKKDNLIKKLSFSLDGDRISAALPEKDRSTMKGPVTVTITHKSIELNPELTDAVFAFDKPDGAVAFQVYYGPARSTRPEEKKMDGTPAPDFTLKDVDGNDVSLSKFRDTVVVLTFWASFSDPCVETIRMMQAFCNDCKGKAVTVLGINTLEGEDADYVKSFLAEQNVTFLNLVDQKDTVIEKYGITKVPTCLVIDTKGMVRHTLTGTPEKQALSDQVKALLAR